MDELAILADEKAATRRAEVESGLSSTGFAVFWSLRPDQALERAGVDARQVAREVETLITRFPNWAENADEQRRLRLGLYKPLLELEKEDRARIVEDTIQILARMTGS
jgi:type I restriction enzyme R subunit